MISLKTSIKIITYLSDIGCQEIQGASLFRICSLLTSVTILLDAFIRYRIYAPKIKIFN